MFSAYYGLMFRFATHASVGGLDVRVWETEEGLRACAETKIGAALELLAQYSPRHLNEIRQHLRGILVVAIPAFGQIAVKARLCLLDSAQLLRNDVTPARVAGVLVHEATHSRLRALGFVPSNLRERERHEHLCLKAELLLAARLPSGDDLREKAEAAMTWPAEMYSTGAHRQRTRERLEELGIPAWLIRLITPRPSPTPSNEEL